MATANELNSDLTSRPASLVDLVRIIENFFLSWCYELTPPEAPFELELLLETSLGAW